MHLITTSFGCFSSTAFLSSSCDFPSCCQTHFVFQISVFRIHLHFLFPSQHVPNLGPVFPSQWTASVLPHGLVGGKAVACRTEIYPGTQQRHFFWTWMYALCSWCAHSLKDLGAQGLVWSMSLKYLLLVIELQSLQRVKRRK